MELRHFDKGRSHLRTVVVDGKVVSWLTLIDYRMRLGPRTVPMGAVAHVETKQRHRRKGYMRALMEDAVRYMKDRGHVVSVVMGIKDFYYRFGYVSCFPDRSMSVYTRVAEAAAREAGRRTKFTCRVARRDDAEDLLAIYDQNTAGELWCTVRDPHYFAGYPKRRQEIHVVEDARKRVVAYAVCDRDKNRLRVRELAARSDAAYPALLGRLGRLAVPRRVPNIEFDITPSHPFAEFCQRYGCQWSTTYHKNASVMMQILDEPRFFAAMAPVLGRRLRRSELAGRSFSLALRTEAHATALRIRKGTVKVEGGAGARTTVRLSRAQLVQLAAGYRSVRDVLAECGRPVSRPTARLLEVLLPTASARIWDSSRFEELHLEPDDLPMEGQA